MRIRVIQKPSETCIDGIQLDRFEPGFEYDLGHSLSAVFLAEGWGEPVVPEAPAVVPSTPSQPAHPVPQTSSPPNLIRENFPPYSDNLGLAIALDRRGRDRRR